MKRTSEVPLNDVSDGEPMAALDTLTVQTRKLLEPLDRLKSLESLASGLRKPRTPAQLHFVKVVEGELPATGAYERAFLKYSTALVRIRKPKQNLSDLATPPAASVQESSTPIPDYEDGQPRPGWVPLGKFDRKE